MIYGGLVVFWKWIRLLGWISALSATSCFAIGIYRASSYIHKTAQPSLANIITNFQWETVAAGLFGLAGGLAVITATQRQMMQTRITDANRELIEVDLLLEHQRKDVEDIKKHVNDWQNRYSNGSEFDPSIAKDALKHLKNNIVNDKLFKLIDANPRLPEDLRAIAKIAHSAPNALSLCSYNSDGQNFLETIHKVSVIAQDYESKRLKLKISRDEFSSFLVNR